MEPKIKSLFVRLETEQRAQRARKAPQDESYMLAGPETGQFLKILIESTRARRIVEVGTSSGYTSIWLALGARATGGHVTTLEQEPKKITLARQHFHEAGVEDVVEIVAGNALESLAAIEGLIDFAFVDAWKDDYSAYLDLLYAKLAPGGLITADNVASQSNQPGIQDYLRHLRDFPDLQTVTVPIGNGVELSQRRTEF